MNQVNTAVKAKAAGAGAEIDDTRPRSSSDCILTQRAQQDVFLGTRPDYRAMRTSLLSTGCRSTTVCAEARVGDQRLQGAVDQTKAATDSHNDLEAEHKKHDEERGTLLTKVEALTGDNDKKTTEIANLSTRIKQQQDDTAREKNLLTTISRELRDRVERQENTLDHPDGYLTFVDYESRGAVEHQSTLVRPQMVMTVFDACRKLSHEKPKGHQATKVGDQFSIARITKTVAIDPLNRRHRHFLPPVAQHPDAIRLGREDGRQPRRQGRPRGLKRMIRRPAAYLKRRSDASLLRQSQMEKRMGEVIKPDSRHSPHADRTAAELPDTA